MAKMLRALIIFAIVDVFCVDAFFNDPLLDPAHDLKKLYRKMDGTKPQQYLDAHNAIRQIMGVQPLRWDRHLARKARRFANSQSRICQLRHSNGPYGENIAWEQYDESTPQGIVQKFIDEQQNYDMVTGTCRCSIELQEAHICQCGHFTQVIWSTTEKVGCAEITCKNDLGKLVMCMYDPPGNVIGQHPLHAVP